MIKKILTELCSNTTWTMILDFIKKKIKIFDKIHFLWGANYTSSWRQTRWLACNVTCSVVPSERKENWVKINYYKNIQLESYTILLLAFILYLGMMYSCI